MLMAFAAICERGEHTPKNQDAYTSLSFKINGEEAILIGVFDGMGGMACGELASGIAKKFFEEAVRKGRIKNQKDIPPVLKSINSAIYKKLKGEGGTTAAVAFILRKKLHAFNIGDSRIYVVRKGRKKAIQITTDHSVVQEMVEGGEITKEQASIHPLRRQLTRAVGDGFWKDADYFSHDLKKGETVLVCSDGLSDVVTPREIQEIVEKNNLKDAREKLFRLARRRTDGGI